MPTVEVNLPEALLAQLERLSEEEFVTEEEAIEELITAGLDAYNTGPDPVEESDMAGDYGQGSWDAAGTSGNVEDEDDDYAF